MTSNKIIESLIAASYLVWLGWLLIFHHAAIDEYDYLLGGITGVLIGMTYFQLRKVSARRDELDVYGNPWRVVVNAVGLVVAAIVLIPKLPPGDVSAYWVMGIFFMVFLYDTGMRFLAWKKITQSDCKK
jgi:hypothetical protein